ncbi:MAG TPA: hypothetical protein VFO00_07520 [Vitreimonas sp.]|nr:hypothetical protein [Vitreimonas sp.]
MGTLIAMWHWIVASLFTLFLLFAMFGYALGFLPALLAGVIYSILPPRWPRILLSPVLGAAAASTFLSGLTLVPGAALESLNLEGLGAWTLAGAGASLVCAVTCRLLNLDQPRNTTDPTPREA